MLFSKILTFGQLTALAYARLNKNKLSASLDYLHQGLVDHLPSPAGQYSKWQPGWIPQDCKHMLHVKNLTADNIEVWTAKYDDCDAPWIICRHKDSLNPLAEVLEHFGRIPVRSRQ